MTFKKIIALTLLCAVVAVVTVWAYGKIKGANKFALNSTAASSSLFKNANYTANTTSGPMVDFEKAATKASPAVVHIRTVIASQVQNNDNGQTDPFRQFFGQGLGDDNAPQAMPEERASGSGVLISSDGYIVTNNHVVDHSKELTVTLNDKTDYKAKVIGTDPSSDLAVIKIDAKDLPYLSFANSDDVHLGQWVLAIGYPLDLETTVTSGIVSALDRNIGINSRNSNSSIESFIQTDAAVNPGNSGGALVNTDGDLIGINSAIASPTGSYAGYSYAIPSNLVQRVANDIVKYGSARRAYLGIMMPNDQMTEADRAKNNIKEGNGVFVMDVAKGSTADEAGIQKGDFVTKINGGVLTSGSELVEKIGALHPGDKINLMYTHNGDEKSVDVTLKGSAGTYASVKEQMIDQLGATFENLDKDQAAQLNIQSGVVVKSLSNGLLSDQTKISEGFIITKVNGNAVSSVDELKAALKNAGNSAVISGVYPNQPDTEYQYALNNLNSN